MSDSFIDSLPSHERGRWERLKLRSPAEYEKLRKSAREHGPAYAEREMKHNAEFAEASLALDTEPRTQEKAQEAVRAYILKHGAEAALDAAPARAKEAIAKGAFEVTVDTQGKEPKLAVRVKSAPSKAQQAPSGNVAEVYPLKAALQKQVIASFHLSHL